MNKQLLREKLLLQQEGKCAICFRKSWCAACGIEILESDIEIIGKGKCRYFHKGFEGHHVQMVNTLDHNHSHKNCKGCEKCARGMTHDRCNRALNIICEGKNSIHMEYLLENYIKRGLILIDDEQSNLLLDIQENNKEGKVKMTNNEAKEIKQDLQFIADNFDYDDQIYGKGNIK